MRTRFWITLFLFLLPLAPASGAVPAESRTTDYPVPIREPVVRIGISTNGVTVKLSSVGDLVVVDSVTRKTVWRKVHHGDLFVVAEPPEGETLKGDRYVIQVASFSQQDNAERFAERLKQSTDKEVSVKFHEDSMVYRVRVGDFLTSDAAFQAAERLRDRGYEELWVAVDPVRLKGAARLRLVDDRYNANRVDSSVLWVFPHRPAGPMKVNDKAYRGLLEVRIDPSGRLQVINIVHIEEYLRGVVPGEMGPAVYPEIEALKAQAVAARTYVVRNLGQFRAKGFDICDTPRCQVYLGIGGEHPLTDKAIEATRGIILEYQGKPINALYTSTCGGHTENVEGVFLEQKAPYLRGVACYPERPEVIRVRRSHTRQEIRLENGASAESEIALMRILGVLLESDLDPVYLAESASPEEIRQWIHRVLRIIGKAKISANREGDPPRTLRDLSRTLVDDLGWEGRIALNYRDRDLPQVLVYADSSLLDAGEKKRFAYFLKHKIFRPFPDDTLRPDHVPSRAMVLSILHGVARSYDSLFLEKGKFLGIDSAKYLIGESMSPEKYRLSSEAYLFRKMGDRSLPVGELVLYPGDSLRFHLQNDIIDWLELKNSGSGLSDDRSSPLSRWEVRYSREKLEKILRDRFPLGTLQDLEIIKTGVSGRVTELLVKGSRGDFRIRGFRIRTALKIRETLFVLDRQFGLDGTVQDFIFSGRGWGHGVGLCQVGAYGMALREVRFDKILHHYYTQVKLRKNYGSGFSRP